MRTHPYEQPEHRIARLKSGVRTFGCPGAEEEHPIHDEFCAMPTKLELEAAGIDPETFCAKQR